MGEFKKPVQERCVLGQEYEDPVSGFKGIAVHRTEYMEGCYRIGLQPPIDKDGKLPEYHSFDEPRLIDQDVPDNGGPRADPQGRVDPM